MLFEFTAMLCLAGEPCKEIKVLTDNCVFTLREVLWPEGAYITSLSCTRLEAEDEAVD